MNGEPLRQRNACELASLSRQDRRALALGEKIAAIGSATVWATLFHSSCAKAFEVSRRFKRSIAVGSVYVRTTFSFADSLPTGWRSQPVQAMALPR